MQLEKKEKISVTGLDLRIVCAVVICCLISELFEYMGVHISYGNMELEVFQKMTAAIACLLCCQDNGAVSLKAGKNRLIITAIGGMLGIFAVLLDNMTAHSIIFVAYIALGLLLTLILCKVARVPYINARIGGVTFILVTCTLSGQARILYAVCRFLSTFLGILVVLAITWIFGRFRPARREALGNKVPGQ
ncbi:MAG: hypothetical protein KHX56_05540 [Clostridiales bacterium]|nr:hypothetical protein [Clostridiales bacterium]